MNILRPLVVIGLVGGVAILILGGFCVAAGIRQFRARPPSPGPGSPYAGTATLEQLQHLPETNLFYPGSVVLATLAYKGDFRNPTDCGYQLGTQASDDEILAFYQQQLRDRGWVQLVHDINGARGSSEYVAMAWSKEGVIFRVAGKDQGNPNAGIASGGSQYKTVYEIVVRNMRPAELTYYPTATPRGKP